MHEIGMVLPRADSADIIIPVLIFFSPQSSVSIFVFLSICIYLIYNTTFTIKMFISPKTWIMELFYDASRWARIILN
jgi:hypothetical protein